MVILNNTPVNYQRSKTKNICEITFTGSCTILQRTIAESLTFLGDCHLLSAKELYPYIYQLQRAFRLLLAYVFNIVWF